MHLSPHPRTNGRREWSSCLVTPSTPWKLSPAHAADYPPLHTSRKNAEHQQTHRTYPRLPGGPSRWLWLLAHVATWRLSRAGRKEEGRGRLRSLRFLSKRPLHSHPQPWGLVWFVYSNSDANSESHLIFSFISLQHSLLLVRDNCGHSLVAVGLKKSENKEQKTTKTAVYRQTRTATATSHITITISIRQQHQHNSSEYLVKMTNDPSISSSIRPSAPDLRVCVCVCVCVCVFVCVCVCPTSVSRPNEKKKRKKRTSRGDNEPSRDRKKRKRKRPW